ncbi:hypothetical protein H8L32_00645 [Undibacterium sp. CY18W]|uniref:DUF3784 domain-containing protein n=1 Tax=Undibacterium hunanense TaxID=2762292 RepID=A0ABR6ZJB0_9BURK|nr:hypothetical protein [Undibacterium hunanense]MBC3915979.1 hypothetical protein [Undibacterium hunanense]
MLENIVFLGFGAWFAFVFAYQFRFLYFFDKAWKTRADTKLQFKMNSYGYVILRVLISFLNIFGVLGLAALYGGTQLLHNSLAGIGALIGIVFFLICHFLIRGINVI